MSLESSNKRRRRRPESTIIPPEILTDEILPRLPATILHSSLKLVCRGWLNLISSPGFIRRHLLLGSNRSIRILVPQTNGLISIDYKKQEFVSSKEKEVLIPYPPDIHGGGPDIPQILGSCDGLILLANKNQRKSNLVVFNPSTGNSELFAPPEHNKHDYLFRFPVTSSWFGHHPTTREYVLVLCTPRRVVLNTFSRENKLRNVQSCLVGPHPQLLNYLSQQDRGILLDGVVYWPAQWAYTLGGVVHTHAVSGYHIEDNKYLEFSPPSDQTYFKLGVWDGFLLLTQKRKEDGVFEVWLMKETGVWTKFCNVEGRCNAKFEILSPLSTFHNGDLIVEGDACILTRYDFVHNKAMFLNRYQPPTCYESLRPKAIVCADSLVSPAIVMEELAEL